MTTGIAVEDLSDEDLRRELAHVLEKRMDMLSAGTPEQLANSTRRMRELETGYLTRFNAGPDAQAKLDAVQ